MNEERNIGNDVLTRSTPSGSPPWLSSRSIMATEPLAAANGIGLGYNEE